MGIIPDILLTDCFVIPDTHKKVKKLLFILYILWYLKLDFIWAQLGQIVYK